MSIANIVHRTEGSPAERYATAREFVTKRAEDLGLDPQVLVRLLDAKELKAIDALLASSSGRTTPSGQTNGSLQSGHFTSMPPAWVQASTESATRLERVLEGYSTPVRERIERLSTALVLDEPELEKALKHPGLRPSSRGQTIVPPRYLLDALAAITGRSVKTGASAPLDLKTVIGVRSWLECEHGTPAAKKISARFVADARHPETRTKLADSTASLTPKLKSFVLNQVRSIALRLTEVAPTYKAHIAPTLRVIRDAVDLGDFVQEADSLAADGQFGAAYNLLSWVREAGEDYSGVNATAYSTLHALQTGRWANAVWSLQLERKPGLDELAVVLEDSSESQPVVVKAELLSSLESNPHTRVYAEGIRKLGEATPDGVVLRIDYPTTSPNEAIRAGMEHIPQALIDAARTFSALNARLDTKAKASAPAAPPSGLESALQESRRVLEGECGSFLRTLRFERTDASFDAAERLAADNNVIRQGQEVTVKIAWKSSTRPPEVADGRASVRFALLETAHRSLRVR
ncbi:MAG: hypothetical protein AAF735_07575 [Myxococcota bacterium]